MSAVTAASLRLAADGDTPSRDASVAHPIPNASNARNKTVTPEVDAMMVVHSFLSTFLCQVGPAHQGNFRSAQAAVRTELRATRYLKHVNACVSKLKRPLDSVERRCHETHPNNWCRRNVRKRSDYGTGGVLHVVVPVGRSAGDSAVAGSAQEPFCMHGVYTGLALQRAGWMNHALCESGLSRSARTRTESQCER
jgi:hypothetical protein